MQRCPVALAAIVYACRNPAQSVISFSCASSARSRLWNSYIFFCTYCCRYCSIGIATRNQPRKGGRSRSVSAADGTSRRPYGTRADGSSEILSCMSPMVILALRASRLCAMNVACTTLPTVCSDREGLRYTRHKRHPQSLWLRASPVAGSFLETAALCLLQMHKLHRSRTSIGGC